MVKDVIDALALVGESLYGPMWKKFIAVDIGVSERTILRWSLRQSFPADPEDLGELLMGLLFRKSEEIKAAQQKVRAAPTFTRPESRPARR